MHTILHIGAGQAHELPQWLETGAERILLVEPNPELAEQLRENTRREPRVTVIEAATTSNPASNQLHEYNLPEASSLRPATGLKQLFPGLKPVNTLSVATLTPAQLMEQYGPEPGEPATLVLQAPGEEHAIIQALAEAEELSYFNQLLITANPEPLYEGSEAAETLLNTLQTLGYNVQQENQQDPDWPTWQLARDPQQDKIAALNQGLQALEEQLKDKSTNLLELTQQKEALKQQLTLVQQQKAEADQRAQSAEQALTEADKARSEADKARTQAEKARAEEKEQQKAREQKLNAELEALRQQATTEKEQAIAKAQRQLEEAQQAHKAAKDTLQQQHQAALAKQAEQLKALEQQLADIQQQKAKADQRAKNAEQALTEAEKARAEEKEQQKAREQKLNAELEKEQQAHQQTTQALEEHKQWFRSRKTQAEELQAENSELKKQLEQLNIAVATLRQEKQQLQNNQSQGQQAISQLEQKMENLFSQQATQLTQAANALGKHVTQSFSDQRQHFQAVTSLNHYLESGTQPLEYGSWAIGADLATHLVRAIESSPYDLIIEFGSGTSTVLMARALMNKKAAVTTQSQNSHLEYDSENDTNAPALTHKKGQGSTAYDLPQRILSFEQNKAYRQKTATALAVEGLTNLVDLVLAPLVPMYSGQQQGQLAGTNSPLFYDCHSKLARIAQIYEGRQARILVLVDGPHSPEGNPIAREPALASLLQHLAAHQLDIVLDDSHRPGEQQVAQAWLQLCEQRGLECQQQQLKTEKGAYWLTVNP